MVKDILHASSGSAGGHRETPAIGFRPRHRRLWLATIFFTALVSLAPLVIMTLVNSYQYGSILRAEMINPIARLVSTSKRYMSDYLQEHRSALAYVVNRETYEDLCDSERLNLTLLHLNSSFGGFVDLGVIDSDGNQRSYVGHYELEGKNYAVGFFEVII